MRTAWITTIAVLVAACSTTASDDDFDALDSWIAKTKTAEVDTIKYSRIASWKVLDRKHLILYVDSKRKPYLVSVAGVCNDLKFAQAIGIQSNSSFRIYRGDKIVFRDQRCLIDRISPVTQEQLDALPK